MIICFKIKNIYTYIQSKHYLQVISFHRLLIIRKEKIYFNKKHTVHTNSNCGLKSKKKKKSSQLFTIK